MSWTSHYSEFTRAGQREAGSWETRCEKTSLFSFLSLLCSDQPEVSLYYLSSVLSVDCCQNLCSQLRSSESSSEAEVEIKLSSCFLSAACINLIVSGSRFPVDSQLCRLTFEPLASLARLLVVPGLLLGGDVGPGLPWDALFSFPLLERDSSPLGRKPWKLWIFSIVCVTNCWLPALSLFSYMSYKISLLLPSQAELKMAYFYPLFTSVSTW